MNVERLRPTPVVPTAWAGGDSDVGPPPVVGAAGGAPEQGVQELLRFKMRPCVLARRAGLAQGRLVASRQSPEPTVQLRILLDR